MVVYQSKSVVSSATIVMSEEDRMMWKVIREGCGIVYTTDHLSQSQDLSLREMFGLTV